jgi:regulation of enolase protein 1 (concanavalin A-like superfamily)
MNRVVRVPAILVALALWAAPSVAQAQDRLCDPGGEDCREILISHIRAENVGLDVAFWFMEDSWIAAEVIARHNARVPVRVLMDTRANAPNPRNAQRLAELQAAGIPMRERFASGILHWKAMIFAGQGMVEFSGANYSSDAWVPAGPPYTNYVDEIIYFTRKQSVVQSFMRKYDDLWTNTTQYRDYANINQPLWRAYPGLVDYPFDPELNFPPAEDYGARAVSTYYTETQKMDVIMYRITDRRHTDALIDLHVNRGLPIRLITDPQQYRDPNRLWHSWNIDRLYVAGIPIKWRAHAGLNHQKSIILYGRGMSIFGSSNWTSPSAFSQEEHNYFTRDTFVFNWLVDQFERKWNNSTGVIENSDFAPLPPRAPDLPIPAYQATGVGIDNVELKWDGSPWAHLYDVYFGTSPGALQRIGENLPLGPSQFLGDRRSFMLPMTLQPGTQYYWQVVGKTMANMTATSGLWTFTTDGNATPPEPLPAPWSAGDIGAVGMTGATSYASGVFTVRGAGADVWGTADALHYVSQPLSGDFDIVAHLASIENIHAWTKAGVMIRETQSASSPQAFMLASPGKGLAFQRRVASGGESSSTSGGAGTAPVWVKLERRGNTISAYRSDNGSAWTLVGSDTFSMGANVFAGLAVSSHTTSQTATATFSSVSVSGGGTTPTNTPPVVSLTAPANGASFTAPATINLAASASDSDGTITSVQFFAGTTLIGTDTTAPFAFAWSNVPPGSYSLTARAIDNGGASTASAAVAVTVNGSTPTLPAPWVSQDIGAVGAAGTASVSGGTFTVEGGGADVWGTADALHYAWQQVTGDVDVIARVATIENVHAWTKAGVMIRGTLDPGSAQAFMLVSPGKGLAFQRRVTASGLSTSTPGGSGTAPRWVKLARRGSTITAFTSSNGVSWTLVGSDTFSMGTTVHVGLGVSSHVSGNLATATFDNVSVVGASDTEPSGNVAPTVALTSPASGATFTAPATVSLAANASDADGTVARVEFYNGSTLLATDTTSPYEASWTDVPAGTYTITARAFDDLGASATSAPVSVTVNGPAPPALPAPWAAQDIGAVGAPGTASASGGTFTLEGAGADVWGAADALHYLWQPVTGDVDIVARVATIENVHAWTKAGVMIRETLDPGSPHAFMLASPGKGLAFQRRVVAGGVSTHTSGGAGTAPAWVKLERRGNVITAFTSLNGAAWTLVGSETFSMAASIHVGIGVSSHVSGNLATATFDNLAVVPR